LFHEVKDQNTLDYKKTLPDTKLYYPEPFIASPSFLHEEIWFIHILHYNYWLWFFFITLIMFYFITFIHTVRWCNLRLKPKRETRGVSRSKCADLITACVPVSWALSIIVSETVDATDYYDGFGTGEMIIGIRAYQWGWEYFYPKNIDLNYNVTPSFSSFTGNSLKYHNTSSEQLDAGVLWKFYQKKNKTAQSNTPAYTILSPNDINSSFNIIDFSDIGNSISKDSNAFKKISRISKISHNNISTNLNSNNVLFTKVNNLYLSPTNINIDTYQYGSYRQHTLTSLNSILPYFSSLVDTKSYKTFFDYTLNTTHVDDNNFLHTNFFTKVPTSKPLNLNNFNNRLLTLLSNDQHGELNYFLRKFLLNFNTSYGFNATIDTKGKSFNNFFLNYYSKKPKKLLNLKKTGQFILTDDLTTSNKASFYSWNLFNSLKNYRFIDLKSNNLQFLSSDKNLRTAVNSSLLGIDTNFSSNASVPAFFNKK